MTVEARMTSPVITISPTQTCDHALSLMDAAGIDHLVVCEGDRIVGLLERKRLLERVAALLEPGVSRGEVERFLPLVRAAGVMTLHPRTIAPEASLAGAADAFGDGLLTALPVVDHDRLVGILTVHDLLLSIVDGRLDRANGVWAGC